MYRLHPVLSENQYKRDIKSLDALKKLGHEGHRLQDFVLGKNYSSLPKQDVFAAVSSTVPDVGALI
jgi:hypothetical protein